MIPNDKWYHFGLSCSLLIVLWIIFVFVSPFQGCGCIYCCVGCGGGIWRKLCHATIWVFVLGILKEGLDAMDMNTILHWPWCHPTCHYDVKDLIADALGCLVGFGIVAASILGYTIIMGARKRRVHWSAIHKNKPRPPSLPYQQDRQQQQDMEHSLQQPQKRFKHLQPFHDDQKMVPHYYDDNNVNDDNEECNSA